MSTLTNPAPTLLKIAASHYLNSAPLIWSFLHGSQRDRVTVIDAVPSRCAELLSGAKVDVALIPVIEYQRIPKISLINNVCVGSQTEVRSVVLVSPHAELDQVRTVAIDESSRTSATLVKIIFREFLNREPTWTNHTPDLRKMLSNNDAALIIGDPGMTFTREGLHVWDMAALWRKYTGLGFVFAMWAVRDEARTRAKAVDFGLARDEGVAQINRIVDGYAARIPLSREELSLYLVENISFDLDDKMRRGLELYFALAAKHQLTERVRQPKYA